MNQIYMYQHVYKSLKYNAEPTKNAGYIEYI